MTARWSLRTWSPWGLLRGLLRFLIWLWYFSLLVGYLAYLGPAGSNARPPLCACLGM